MQLSKIIRDLRKLFLVLLHFLIAFFLLQEGQKSALI